jgi:hypothetical protein
MKTIFILIILAITIAINTKKLAVPKPVVTCPTRCNCPSIYQPVCGKSGNTHGNSCFAKCFKDPVTKVGQCEPKCLKDTRVKKSSCKVEPYGRTGTRNYCCKWTEVNGVKRREICDYKGPATYVFEKTVCKWKKLSAEKRQRVCCSFSRTKTAKKVVDSKKKCKNIGEIVEIKKKIGCSIRPFGKFGLRKYCCSHKTRCVGKSCRLTHRRCSYKGAVFTERKVKKCKWAQKSKNNLQIKCCSYFSNCKVNNKTKKKKCLKRARKCHWKGKVIKSNRRMSCTLKPFGRNAVRSHCCSYVNKCKGKRCRHTKIRCFWKGCPKIQRLKYHCSFQHVKKNTIRKICCRWSEVSACKRKTFSAKTCRWIGQAIVTKTKRGCKWIQTGKNSRVKQCCSNHKQCQGKKCHFTKKCVNKKKIVSKAMTSCKWKKLGKYTKRKNCCYNTKRCVGIISKVASKSAKKAKVVSWNCKFTKARCSFVGSIIYRRVKNGCKWRKHGKFGKRKFCCKRKRFCVGKKCKVQKKCKFFGKIVKVTRKSSCSIQAYGNQSSRRQLCCTWKNYCVGLKKFKCRPIQKRCQWRGKIHQKVEKVQCKWEKKTFGKKQRHCCRWFRSCVISKGGIQRNCKNGPKVCNWVGFVITKHVRRLCNYKTVGKYGRRKFCCTHFRKCKGKDCQVKKRGCKFFGPTYTRTPSSSCHWKRINKNRKQKKCCYWQNYCVDQKCSESKKHCKNVGKIITTSSFRKCYWKQITENGIHQRRQECCRFKRVKGQKGTKITKKSCVFIGKPVLLEKVYYKRDTKCTVSENRKTCCKRIFKCNTKKNSCKFYKNEKCVLKIIEIKLPSNPATCVSSGDPHYTTFNGQRFDYYKLGDFLLFESRGFTVHTRLRNWGGVSVNTGFAARVNKAGETVQTESRDASELLINDKKVTLKNNQKHYFKFGGYVSKTGNLLKVVSSSGDYIDVQAIPYNNNGNKKYQDHYYNIVARVANKLKYQSGFCINSTPQHVNGLFKTEYNPQKKVQKPVKKCESVKRRRIERKCRNAGIVSHRGITRCVIDVCYGIGTIAEKKAELIKDKVETKKIVKPKLVAPKPVINKRPGVCYSLGDPHYKTFSGKKFDNYFVGDWVLVKLKGLTVHSTTKRWGARASVNKKIAAKLSGDVVIAKSSNKFLLNGETEVDLKVGQKYRLPKGGLVHRVSASRVYFYSNQRGFLDADFIGTGKNRYVNLIVNVPDYTSATGACQGNMIEAKGLFRHETKQNKNKKLMKISKNCHDKARVRCKNNGIKRRFLASCIVDVCSGLGVKGIRRGLRHGKQDK